MRPHPTPTYREIRPAHSSSSRGSSRLPNETSQESLKLLPKKRKVIQACTGCRKAKTKCDGVRPTCITCQLKNRVCGYDEEEIQMPFYGATERLGRLEKLVDALRSSSPDHAERLLQQLRISEDPLTVVETLSKRKNNDPTPPSEFDGSGRDGWSTKSPDILPDSSSETSSSKHHKHRSDAAKDSDNLALFCADREASDQSRSDLKADRSKSLVLVNIPSSWNNLTHLEAADVSFTQRAIDAFFNYSGKLFHVFSQEQTSQFHRDVFNSQNETSEISLKGKVCCLTAVAAVGAQYLDFEADLQAEKRLYDIARYHLDEMIEYQPLDAIKVCTLMTMYNILNKATIALAYIGELLMFSFIRSSKNVLVFHENGDLTTLVTHLIEIGLGLCRKYGLDSRAAQSEELLGSGRGDYLRSWRTLVFFSSWLVSSLGYVSGNDLVSSGVALEDLEVEDSSRIENVVQTELTKICMLKSGIIRMHLMTIDLTASAIQSVLDDLQKWYQKLPVQLRLDYEGWEKHPAETRRSTFHVHLFYLDAIMFLYRRIASQFVRLCEDNTHRSIFFEPLITRVANEAILAASTSSRILNLLLEDKGLFKRCWIVIFAAYTSGIILLHSVAQKQLHNFASTSRADDIARAKDCLSILSFCGSLDQVAERFRDRLAEMLDKIMELEAEKPASMSDIIPMDTHADNFNTPLKGVSGRDGQGQEHNNPSFLLLLPENGDKSILSVAVTILTIICRPFDDPFNQTPPKMTWDALRTMDLKRDFPQITRELQWDRDADVKLRWSLRLPTLTMARCADEDEQITSDSAWGRFLGSAKPSGWASAISSIEHSEDFL